MTRSFWTPAVVTIAAGLILLLTAAGGWIGGEQARTVGGVVVTEPQSVSGTQFAPTAVVFGLGGLFAGVVLALVRGRLRRVAAVIAVLIGLGGAAVVAQGITRAQASEGTLTPAPIFAVAAALTVGVGGAAALRAPARPPQTSRYRVEQDERPEDDEWTVASGDSE